MDEQLSAPQPPGLHPHLVRAVIAGVVLVIIAALASAYFLYQPFRTSIDEAMTVLRIPHELRGAHFYTGAPTYGPQHIEGLQFVRNAAGDTLWLSGSRSPDGSRVVFAISTSTQAIMPFVQAEKVTPSAYQVLMRPTEGSGVQSIAYGYAPAFLDDTHISYFTDAGIAVMDTQTGEATLLFRYPAGTVLSSGVRYSPDRRTVLWTDAMTGESVAGSITPSAYTPLSTFKDLASPVLGNAAVYELRRTHEGQELWKRTLDGSSSAKVLTLPASLSILTMAL